MAKSQVFIASSSRTLNLATCLASELNKDKDFIQARVWSEVSANLQGVTIIEMLEKISHSYDFAIIILGRDDLLMTQAGPIPKARDNCIFEAGMFFGAIGRERCFLLNSVSQDDLPSDLGGIISMPIRQPDDLDDPAECSSIVSLPALTIRRRIRTTGRMLNKPITRETLLEREIRSTSGQGDLEEDQVVVASVQPLDVSIKYAQQIVYNIHENIRYLFLLPAKPDSIAKICALLQMVLICSISEVTQDLIPEGHAERCKFIKTRGEDVLDKLKHICTSGSLKIYFQPASAEVQYCIHNAQHQKAARVYMKHRDQFIEWESELSAYEFWRDIRAQRPLVDNPQPLDALFYDFPGVKLDDSVISNPLKQALYNCFPGIDEKVLQMGYLGSSQG